MNSNGSDYGNRVFLYLLGTTTLLDFIDQSTIGGIVNIGTRNELEDLLRHKCCLY